MSAMELADVSDDLVRAALATYCTTCLQTVGRTPYSDHEEEARRVLAGALPVHEQQLRERAEKAEAELKQLRPEYGIRADWISTLSSEGPVAETLGEALEALAEFDAKHGAEVVKCTLIRRPVGDWEEMGTDG